MTQAKPKYIPTPRPWTEFQVSARLNRGLKWFRQNRPVLEEAGFPRKDSLLGGWDSLAIEHWMNQRSRLDLPDNPDEAAILRIIHARAS